MRGCGVWFGVELSDEDMLIVCASGDGGCEISVLLCVESRWYPKGSKEGGSWFG